MSRSLRHWGIVSCGVGVTLLAAGLQLRGSLRTDDERQELLWTAVAGAGLVLVTLVAWALRRPLTHLLEGPADEAVAPRVAAHPVATLFAASFLCLFLEVMLIRYVGSQVRIFSFYKNIPLISCYLGMGLGCFLRGGRQRDAVGFLLWLLPFSVALSSGSIVASRTLGRWAAFGSSEQILGDVVVTGAPLADALSSQFFMAAFAVAALVAITLLFVPLGRLLGEAFLPVARLHGYTVNILGSLVGVASFVGASYAWTPPWVWFCLGLLPLLWWVQGKGARTFALVLVAANAAAVWPSSGDTVWSPYQKLIGRKQVSSGGQESFLVDISDVFYQVAVNLRPEAVAKAGVNIFPHYDMQFAGMAPGGRVVVVGAGTGNDVAAALRAGAGRVDAVDIDPAIVRMGRLHHPERPYDDPRVNVVVDDARSAFRDLPSGAYDAVVFGLLDSHTQLGVSSLRLDNYVFTLESFEDARRLLGPQGRFIVTAATFREWFGDRLALMVAVTCGGPVDVRRSGAWVTYSCTPASVPDPNLAALRDATTLPTDDWPFLYLPEAEVPGGYLLVIGALALASVLVLRARGLPMGRLDASHWHLFFMGAAFLLVEVHAINRLALLFGSTWLVSAVTIALVLVLILAANLFAGAVPRLPQGAAYAGLFASLALTWVENGSSGAGQGPVGVLTHAFIQVLPVFCAGLIFARSFGRAADAGSALGANMLGAVLGGWVEYASMAVGIRALVLLAAVLYLGSLLALLRTPRPAPQPGT